jgi:tripartite-type tricarboxylate transporter receptor subunit TctC
MDVSGTATMAVDVHPQRLIVPFPPGGSTFFTAEELARRLEAVFGAPVEVEACTGDSGFDAVRRLCAAGDDATLLVGNINANSILPVLRRGEAFDYAAAVRPVTRLAEFPSVVMTRPDFPADSLSAFLQEMGARRGLLRYGTDFLGTYVDYDMLMLARTASVEIAYRAASGALAILEDLCAGNTDLAMLNVATAARHRDRFKPLAVTAPARLAAFPQVPTMAEAGFAGIGTSNWQGVFIARAAAPEAIAGAYAAVVAAMDDEAVRAAFADVGARVALSAEPSTFENEIAAEMREWERALPDIRRIPKVDDSGGNGR